MLSVYGTKRNDDYVVDVVVVAAVAVVLTAGLTSSRSFPLFVLSDLRPSGSVGSSIGATFVGPAQAAVLGSRIHLERP